MIVFFNGVFMPADQARVSVLDRGFLYGDGLFETLRVHRGRPLHWRRHLERWTAGARLLQIETPLSPATLRQAADELIGRQQIPDGVLRLTLSRGRGGRGYAPRDCAEPVTVMSLDAAPPLPRPRPLCWGLATSSWVLPAHGQLTAVKSANKLVQVLARAQAEAAGANEGLLLNTAGRLAEGAASNLFWVEAGGLRTPSLAEGPLAGVTRSVVIELGRQRGLDVRETSAGAESLAEAEGVFLTLSTWGLVEVQSLDGHALRRWPQLVRLYQAYLELADQGTEEG